MTGSTQEDYAKMMLAGGRSVEGNRSRSGVNAPGKSGKAKKAKFKDSSERAFLVAKLRENAWNISKTAEVIDTPRSNLYKKLEQYQISQETDG